MRNFRADAAGLPDDPDVDVVDTSRNALRPLHLRPSVIALVAVGGALGTAAREAVSIAMPHAAAVPWPTFIVNIVGAFMLGLLLEALSRRGQDQGARQRLRLVAGTGFLGGFTTYSALATESALLVSANHLGIAVLYAVGTVIVGGLATVSGIVVGSRGRGQLNRREKTP